MESTLTPNTEVSLSDLQVSLLGGLAIVLLWATAAFYVAPAIEVRLQAQAAQLLKTLNLPISAVADGLWVRVGGAIPERDTEFEVRRLLSQLHPLARVQIELDVVAAVEELVLPKDRRLHKSLVDDVKAFESSSCQSLKELDPNFVCRF